MLTLLLVSLPQITTTGWLNQVIDAVLRRHGVGCMLDWVETELVLKEKTTNIQASERPAALRVMVGTPDTADIVL